MKKAGFLSLLALVCMSVALVSQATSGTQPANKIFGGNEAKPGEFPFMAAIFKGTPTNQTFQCGASLIDDRYLLSSAHCMPKNKSQPLTVKLGCHNLTEPCVEMEIEDFLEHEDYRTKNFDVAILRVKERVEFIEPIWLPGPMHGDYKVGERLMIIGWGGMNSVDNSTVLMKAEVSAWTSEQCETLHASVPEASICAGSPTQGTCYGDFGGPLFRVDPARQLNTLLGITSAGARRCDSSDGEIFARVSYFNDWIEASKSKLEAASSTPIPNEDEPIV